MLLLPLILPLLSSALIPLNLTTPEIDETSAVVHIETKITEHADTRFNGECSCTKYVNTKRPDVPWVNASELRPATSTPYVGGVMLFFYPTSGLHHAAVILSVDGAFVLVEEVNYTHEVAGDCPVTRRWVDMNDPLNRVIGII